MSIEGFDIGKILTFVGGGGFLWVLQYALSLRKQKKDEFVILRETWAKEGEKNQKRIETLELIIQKQKEYIRKLKKEK